jgi:hypothetical protein
MTELTDLTTDFTEFARDAAYVVIGLGVLGFQKAQVQRVELTNKLTGDLNLDERLAEVRTAVATGVQQIDGLVEGAANFVESTLQPLEEQLPPLARELAQKAHAQAREVRAQIRELVGPSA